MSSPLGSGLHNVNPYEGYSSVTGLESEVLWQYAKLAQNIKELAAETRRLSEAPDEAMLNQLRALEMKMGLVLTLFKASVWAVINDQPAGSESMYGDTTANETSMS
ncbi:hypothetical protein QCA50_006797 [Cerrena zonata]|uniref:DASH complex subunit DAD3 n=1 Tax=Cerrena zonata TaxID=2478898 RepID=A0AAW0G9N4_9APHY